MGMIMFLILIVESLSTVNFPAIAFLCSFYFNSAIFFKKDCFIGGILYQINSFILSKNDSNCKAKNESYKVFHKLKINFDNSF